LALSLANADRLFDFIRASTLACCYFYAKARLAEGHNCGSTALKFAIACGFHNIDSVSLDTKFYLVPPCADLIELGDRINTFWTLLCGDRAGSLVSGHPETIADDKITTVWPCPSQDYESGEYLLQPTGTLTSMYDPDLTLIPAEKNNYLALRTMGIVLLHRTSILSARVKSVNFVDDSLRRDIFCASRAASNLADTLPTFSVQGQGCDDPDAIRSILAPAFIAAHAAVIQIYGVLADDKLAAHARQVQAASAAMAIVKELRTVQYSYIPILFGWALTPVHDFLIREKMERTLLGDEEGATALQEEITVLIHTLKRVDELFPKPAIVQVEILAKNAALLRLTGNP